MTEGTRSIPRIIATDENGKELFRWGPRPSEAQTFFEKCLQDGFDKAATKEKFYSWMAKDQGKSIEKEFLEIMHHIRE